MADSSLVGLRRIADELRGAPRQCLKNRLAWIKPDTNDPEAGADRYDVRLYVRKGGQLLAEAITLGAFAGQEYADLRQWLETCKQRFADVSAADGGWPGDFFGTAGTRLWDEPPATLHDECNLIADALEAEIKRIKTPGGDESTATPPPPSDNLDEMVSPDSFGQRFGLDERQRERLRSRLREWRKPANSREWTELPDRRPHQSKYLYRLGAIRHLIEAVKTAGEISG